MDRDLEGSGWGLPEVPSWHMAAGSEDNYVKPASIAAVWPVYIWVIPAHNPQCCRYTRLLGQCLHCRLYTVGISILFRLLDYIRFRVA